jgi:hypothetical protein
MLGSTTIKGTLTEEFLLEKLKTLFPVEGILIERWGRDKMK